MKKGKRYVEATKLVDENDKNYFIKGYIDRFDNLQNQVNIIDYKSKKANGVLQDKLEEIKNFKDFQTLSLLKLYKVLWLPTEMTKHLLQF